MAAVFVMCLFFFCYVFVFLLLCIDGPAGCILVLVVNAFTMHRWLVHVHVEL
jgi:hypothetical protein